MVDPDSPTRWDYLGLKEVKEALQNTVLVDAAWLVSLSESNGILPRCQEVPPEAHVTLSEMEAWPCPNKSCKVAILSISYPWLHRDHPDPRGEQLKKISFVLRAFAKQARSYGPNCKVGVFWDYCAIPQRSPSGADDRTAEQLAVHKRALKTINTWYACQQTYVLLVTTALPDSATNRQSYNGRGWCLAEMAMASIVKDASALLDLSQLEGTEETVGLIERHGRARRRPPMAPDAFSKMLHEGVASGSVCFTNLSDAAIVSELYERAFSQEMAQATELYYERCGAIGLDPPPV